MAAGGKMALFAIAQTILDPGDEVLIPLPYWVSYGEQVKLVGGVPKFVKANNETHKVTVKELEEMRTERPSQSSLIRLRTHQA